METVTYLFVLYPLQTVLYRSKCLVGLCEVDLSYNICAAGDGEALLCDAGGEAWYQLSLQPLGQAHPPLVDPVHSEEEEHGQALRGLAVKAVTATFRNSSK